MGLFKDDGIKKELRDSILAGSAAILLFGGGTIWSSYSTGLEAEFMGSSTESVGGSTWTSDEVGVPGSTALAGIGIGITYSLRPRSVIGPFWQDSSGGWHWNNAVPYSYVEKRASQIYDALHGNKETKESFPVVVAENQETYEFAEKLLRGGSPGAMDRTLEILEKALSNETNDILP